MTLAAYKRKPGYGAMEVGGDSFGVNAEPHGTDDPPPVGVKGCATCGKRTKDKSGHWTNKLKNNVPWCGNPECLCCDCGNVLGQSYLVTNKGRKVCGAKKCRLRVAAKERQT